LAAGECAALEITEQRLYGSYHIVLPLTDLGKPLVRPVRLDSPLAS
jgi:hypothetical protein